MKATARNDVVQITSAVPVGFAAAISLARTEAARGLYEEQREVGPGLSERPARDRELDDGARRA